VLVKDALQKSCLAIIYKEILKNSLQQRVNLDLASLVDGRVTKYGGQFEERMKAL